MVGIESEIAADAGEGFDATESSIEEVDVNQEQQDKSNAEQQQQANDDSLVTIPMMAPLSSIDPPSGHPSLPPLTVNLTGTTIETKEESRTQSLSPSLVEDISVSALQEDPQRAITPLARSSSPSPVASSRHITSRTSSPSATSESSPNKKIELDLDSSDTTTPPCTSPSKIPEDNRSSSSPPGSPTLHSSSSSTSPSSPTHLQPPREAELPSTDQDQASRPNTTGSSITNSGQISPTLTPLDVQEQHEEALVSSTLPLPSISPTKAAVTKEAASGVGTSSSRVLNKHVNDTTAVYMADPIPWNNNKSNGVDHLLVPTALEDVESTRKERKSRQWADKVPDSTTAISLQAELDARHSKYIEDKENAATRDSMDNAAAKLARIKREQEDRLKKYEEEDSALLAQLEAELEKRRRERIVAEKQRRLELQDSLEGLVDSSLIPEVTIDGTTIGGMGMSSSIPTGENHHIHTQPSGPEIIREMPPTMYEPPMDLPSAITEARDPVGSLDQMVADEEARKKIKGGENMTQEQYEMIKNKMANKQLERDEKLRHLDGEEQVALYTESAMTIQRVGRGYIGRKRALLFKERRDLQLKLTKGVVTFQSIIRGQIGRKRYAEKRKLWLLAQKKGDSALNLQRCFRGYVGRKIVRKRRQFVRSRDLQRVYRGHMGRKAFNREKTRMQMIARKINAANKIISLWRMKVGNCTVPSPSYIQPLKTISHTYTHMNYINMYRMHINILKQ